MKPIITLFLVLASLFLNAQSIKRLDNVGSKDNIPTDQAIIYGNFIQRMGLACGGFPQDIHLLNLDSKEVFAFRV